MQDSNGKNKIYTTYGLNDILDAEKNHHLC